MCCPVSGGSMQGGSDEDWEGTITEGVHAAFDGWDIADLVGAGQGVVGDGHAVGVVERAVCSGIRGAEDVKCGEQRLGGGEVEVEIVERLAGKEGGAVGRRKGGIHVLDVAGIALLACFHGGEQAYQAVLLLVSHVGVALHRLALGGAYRRLERAAIERGR